jgi:5-hydroxyisourate hydrolase-like protein (transthyretin family)
MKYVLLAAFVYACTLAAQPKPGTGSVEGHVFNSVTGAPVRKASVSLMGSQLQVWLTADTDANGRFEFMALPSGAYKLTAKHSGFLDHAARRPIILGEDGHVTDAEIRLPPQGVISGHVLDEDGDPVDAATVTLFHQTYQDGRKQWGQLRSVPINDTGEYRFPNLSPGRYLVQALSQRPIVNNQYGDQPKMDYVPAYYPNAPSEQTAAPVEVAAGADVRGIDIRLLRVARRPSFRVSGRVIGAKPGEQISISVSETDGGRGGGSDVTSAPDYAFGLSVSAGQYAILANVYSGGGPTAYATGSVNVAGNVTDLLLTMTPAPDVPGHISVAESGSQVNLNGVRVFLRRIPMWFSSREVQSDATGKFVFPEPMLPPGHFAVDVNPRSLPEGCFVQKATLGGREVSLDDFEILTSAPLEIVLSNTAGTITGSVSDDDGKPFPYSTVTLIPPDGTSRPVKQSVDDDGKFKLANLRPGKYNLFAWEEVDDGLWPDPEFRKKYESRATEITVSPGETQNAQLRVIAAEEMK